MVGDLPVQQVGKRATEDGRPYAGGSVARCETPNTNAPLVGWGQTVAPTFFQTKFSNYWFAFLMCTKNSTA